MSLLPCVAYKVGRLAHDIRRARLMGYNSICFDYSANKAEIDALKVEVAEFEKFCVMVGLNNQLLISWYDARFNRL